MSTKLTTRLLNYVLYDIAVNVQGFVFLPIVFNKRFVKNIL